MSPAIPTPPAPGLAPEWQDWLAGNVLRGCSDADMLAAMRDSGFDAQYARTAIAVVRSMTERVQRTDPAALAPYAADPSRLADANRIAVGDREVSLLFDVRDPHVAMVDGLLSEDECERLIALSAGKLRRSEVVDPGGGLAVSGVRSSEGTHFAHAEDPVVDRLERRIAALLGKPVEHGEPLQILHYGPGGEYLPHHDWFDPAQPGTAAHLANGGQRVATVVVYLNAPRAGGETRFPELGLAVRPRRGAAVVFEYANAAGEVDPRLLHAGAPVLAGEKWIATKWLRAGAWGASLHSGA